jgi:polar amino acid transport system substrate-binding protein
MTLDRRTALTGISASALAILLPTSGLAQSGGTLDQIKQRGSIRIGVTQAPPWFFKDPKSGEWSSGFGISMGKAMASSLGV